MTFSTKYHPGTVPGTGRRPLSFYHEGFVMANLALSSSFHCQRCVVSERQSSSASNDKQFPVSVSVSYKLRKSPVPRLCLHGSVIPFKHLNCRSIYQQLAVCIDFKHQKHNGANTKHTKGPRWRVREATKLVAETRDPPSQDPRDHKEQP